MRSSCDNWRYRIVSVFNIGGMLETTLADVNMIGFVVSGGNGLLATGKVDITGRIDATADAIGDLLAG